MPGLVSRSSCLRAERRPATTAHNTTSRKAIAQPGKCHRLEPVITKANRDDHPGRAPQHRDRQSGDHRPEAMIHPTGQADLRDLGATNHADVSPRGFCPLRCEPGTDLLWRSDQPSHSARNPSHPSADTSKITARRRQAPEPSICIDLETERSMPPCTHNETSNYMRYHDGWLR